MHHSKVLSELSILLFLQFAGCGTQTSMEGAVMDGSDFPLSNVTVVAKQLQPIKGYEEVRTVTSTDGIFQLKKLYPDSPYELHVEGKNWISHWRDYDTVFSGPKGETTLLPEPLMVTMAVTKTGSLIFDLESGICRFEISPQGYISDATSPLEWYVLPSKMTWFEARDRIRQMGNGWRMPRMEELGRLYVKGLGTCNTDPVFDLQYGDMFSGDFYGGCVWSDYLKRLPFNLTISHSFRYPYGNPSPQGGEPDANKNKMRAFAVRSLEDK